MNILVTKHLDKERPVFRDGHIVNVDTYEIAIRDDKGVSQATYFYDTSDEVAAFMVGFKACRNVVIRGVQNISESYSLRVLPANMRATGDELDKAIKKVISPNRDTSADVRI